MQPLFETAWALPSSIAPQKTQKSGKAANQRDSAEQSITKQADQLQNQLSRLNNNIAGKPNQQKNKKRQNDSDQSPSKKAKLNKKAQNNVEAMETDTVVEKQLNSKKQKNKKKKGPEQTTEEKPAIEETSVAKENPAEEKSATDEKPVTQEKSATEEKKPIADKKKAVADKKKAVADKKKAVADKKKAVADKKKVVAEEEVVAEKKPEAKATGKKKTVSNDQKTKLQQLLAKKNEPKEENVPVEKKVTNQGRKEEKAQPTKQSNAKSALTPMQQKMKEKLSGARFRWLNEQLYTTKGDESFTLFKEKPELFNEYHEGFRHQVESWPQNPVDIIVKQLSKLPAGTVVADLGCGDAKIAHTLKKQKVLSFDMVAKNDKVVACDIAKLPLPEGFVDVAVFSLALMGTNYLDFLKEAKRILKTGGELKIAEVVSRFTDVESFIELLEQMGFEFISKDDSNKMFIMLYFTKQGADADEEIDEEMMEGLTKAQKRALKRGTGGPVPMSKLQKKAEKLLKPCVYKKR